MRYFYLFLLRWTQFDLRIAMSAPSPNKLHILQLKADERKWLDALQDLEIQNV